VQLTYLQLSLDLQTCKLPVGGSVGGVVVVVVHVPVGGVIVGGVSGGVVVSFLHLIGMKFFLSVTCN